MICASSPILVFTSYGGWSKATPTFLEAPANPLERSSRQTLLSLPPPQHPPPRHLTPIPRGSAPGAAPLHIAEVLDEPSSPTGPAQALLTVTQNKGITPGKKQMLCSTCASPARGPVATSITPGSHLSVDLPLCAPTCYTQLFPKRITDTPGAWARLLLITPTSTAGQPNPLLSDLGAPSALGVFTIHSPVSFNDFPSSLQ